MRPPFCKMAAPREKTAGRTPGRRGTVYCTLHGKQLRNRSGKTAAGLLALEGELTPILVQMVKSANMNGLLDSDSDSLSSCQQKVKARLHEIMQKDADFSEQDQDKLAPTNSSSLLNSMESIKNPVKTCDLVFSLIENLTSQIRQRLEDPKSAAMDQAREGFSHEKWRYDISKIPDIYDCVKYDVQHNSSLNLDGTDELFKLSKSLADVIIPQEYGINKEEKLEIALGYCLPLINKILLDLQRTHEDESVNKLHPLYSRGVLSPGRHVRTRLYFTSESHVHSLLSIFRYGGLLDESKDQQWKRAMDYLSAVSELNYMTQIVIMLYEDNNKDASSEERFHVELHFSPGVKGCEEDEKAPLGFGFRPASAENEDKKTDQGSLEDLTKAKGTDDVDRSILMSPMPSEPIGIHRKSPLTRARKTGSMEAYFVCPVEGLSDLSRCLRTAVLCSALNRADKVRLRRSRSMKARRGRHRKKMGGAGPDCDTHRTRPQRDRPWGTGIVGRWRAVCVTALQRPHSDAAAIGIVV
ncbi:unnamed protein product [Ranitomeya imitator]|uniref:Inositol hexakisphosphate and diphosphoinositol-pentakisphosphate kinase n=1 Tax=Ranitomeya imitator TaxID=111125 RepID=A0ABN9KU57_9NEOB|nr:unnamed protein product [Ranitomeya imitator]